MTTPSTPQEAQPQRGPLILQWGRDEDTDTSFEARVFTPTELANVLARINDQAFRNGIAFMVQVWAEGTMRQLGPGPAEPEVLIEAIIGDQQGAGLRWLGDDAEAQAVDLRRPGPPQNIIFDNAGTADALPPSVFRLALADVQQILTEYLESGYRTRSLVWTRLTFLSDPEP